MTPDQLKTLEQLTKAKMQYCEDVISCENCLHSHEDDNTSIECTFSELCSFKVARRANCRYFKAKEQTPSGF